MKLVTRCASAALCLASLVAAPATLLAEDGKRAAEAVDTKSKSTRMPVDMDGVLLDDGRQIEGEYEEMAGQKWVITPKAGGEKLTVWVTQIVVAEKGGQVEQLGEECEAAYVWRNAVKAAAAEAKTSGGDAAAKAARIDGLLKGADWCAKRDFVTAATSFVNEVAKLDSARAAEMAERTKKLMPDSFFFKEKPDAAALWAKWADALLPSSARFVHKDEEDVWNRLENAPWLDGATLAFRTTNVILFIRDMDPAVCGKALRLAEQTVHGLQLFFNEGEPDLVTGDGSRLEIRIHKNRADYLSEEPKRGKKADPWSAGYFAPWDLCSHFYVDQLKGGAPNIEELTRVLTHEFTHHYITARWIPRIITARGAQEQSGGVGYWVVEGIAEFIQYQSHKLDQREPKFDDDSVAGLREIAQIRKAGIKPPNLRMERFVDMSQGDMRAMDDMEKHVFYAQAGALSHFFLLKKGPEIRKKFIRYVSDHYAGNVHREGWAFLGIKSAQDLENEFDAFLRGLGGR